MSYKTFRYVISDLCELAIFTEGARNADLHRVSGGSGAIFEVEIILESAETELRYIASVHIYELEDLFISNVFMERSATGGWGRGPSKEVRIPGLGQWIMRMAPVVVSSLGKPLLNPTFPCRDVGTESS